MQRVKILHIIFLIILFFELLASVGAIIYGTSSAIRDAGATNTFLIVVTAIVVLIPWMVENRYDIDIPDYLEVILISMLFIGVFLGFLHNYYVDVKGFDKITHTLSGVTLSVMAFQAIYVFNQSNNTSFHMGPVIIAIFAYTLSITLLVIWEFYEFTIDTIAYNRDMLTTRNMQRYQWVLESKTFPQDYGLYDTMIDLIVGAIGSFVVSVGGYFLVRKKAK